METLIQQRQQRRCHRPSNSSSARKQIAVVNLLMAVIVLCSQIEMAAARKSYVVKEKIQRGELKVHRPRVQTTDVQFCLFKDAHNDWCADFDEDWTLGVYNEYRFDEQIDENGTPPSYRGYQMYNSTQQATWSTAFNLARLYYSSLKLTMDSFSAGFRFEVLYWIEKYAFCLNFVQFSTPITIKILIDNRMEQCSKTLIDCFDDWSTWTSVSADMLDSCSQSTSTEWALWEWTPWAENMEHYYFGSALYNRAICFPGFSPFYSYIKEYPNNLWLQAYEMGTDLYSFATRLSVSSAANYAYAFARTGIDVNNMMMEGPIDRGNTTMADLEELTRQEAVKRSPGIRFDQQIF